MLVHPSLHLPCCDIPTALMIRGFPCIHTADGDLDTIPKHLAVIPVLSILISIDFRVS